jgi:hypothetical protein
MDGFALVSSYIGDIHTVFGGNLVQKPRHFPTEHDELENKLVAELDDRVQHPCSAL